MKDARVDKLADLLVNISLEVQPKQRVMLQGAIDGEPLKGTPLIWPLEWCSYYRSLPLYPVKSCTYELNP